MNMHPNLTMKNLSRNAKIYCAERLHLQKTNNLDLKNKFPLFNIPIDNPFQYCHNNNNNNNHAIISTHFRTNSNNEINFNTKHLIKMKNKPMIAQNKYTSNQNKIRVNNFCSHSFSEKVLKTEDFSNKNEINPNNVNKKEEIKISSQAVQRNCKICFEDIENASTGKLISPCQCSGSMKFIHQECLKTWLISQKIHLSTANCEICHKIYKMDFEFGKKFYWRQAIHEGLLSLILSIFLIFMILGVVIMIILIFNKM